MRWAEAQHTCMQGIPENLVMRDCRYMQGDHTAARQPTRRPGSSSSSAASTASRALAWARPVLQQGVVFGGISGGTFLLLGLAFYQLYGHTFLHEAFLHHTTRKDPRHNFSVYYYPIYLDFMPWPAQSLAATTAAPLTAAIPVGSIPAGAAGIMQILQPLQQLLAGLPVVDVNRLAALPQLALLLVLSVSLHADLPLCWLLQTWAFVAFNKVSTAQYFVWYLSFLPIALQRVPWPLPKRLQVAGVAWAVTQLHWLLWGYLLEFEGRGVHLGLWSAGVVFLAANAVCMCTLIQCCRKPATQSG